MGLDMYLERKLYVKRWEHLPPEQQHEVTVKQGSKPYDGVDPAKVKYVIEEAMYWRKANHIHRWFVENVQNGEDDCREYYVSREQLAELRKLCRLVLDRVKLIEGKVVTAQVLKEGAWQPELADGKVVANPEVCQELLPTTEGFFFGGTEYDEWYLDDVKATERALTEILDREKDEGEYYYQSSW